MAQKFDFNEIVKVVDKNLPEGYEEIAGELGVIRGKLPEDDEEYHKYGKGKKNYCYGVLIISTRIVWSIDEPYLTSTGEFVDPSFNRSGQTLRVAVDAKTGEGRIVDS